MYMTVELIQVERGELEAMLNAILDNKLKDIREAVLYVPDTTILSDEEAARRLGKSVSTLRRMKRDGRIKSLPTPKGLVVRVCDLEAK
jgi:hypothetical protein